MSREKSYSPCFFRNASKSGGAGYYERQFRTRKQHADKNPHHRDNQPVLIVPVRHAGVEIRVLVSLRLFTETVYWRMQPWRD